VARTEQEARRLTGTSTKSIDDAAGRAVARAIRSGFKPDWFELETVHGQIREGRIANFRVALTLGVAKRSRS